MKRDLELYAQVRACEECPLSLSRNLAVPAAPGRDYEPGGLAIIGDYPGRLEDEHGTPFKASAQGRRQNAGGMLTMLIKAAGLSRRELLLMYLVRCMPTNGRIQDAPSATANCDPWNVEELLRYDPAVVILMGNIPMRSLFGQAAFISHVRGMAEATGPKHPWGPRVYVPTFNPKAVLHNEDLFDGVVQDLRNAKTLWEQVSGTVPF